MNHPRRLHPGTIALRILARGPSTLLALPALIALLSRNSIFPLIGLVAGIGVVAGAIGWLNWRAFSYMIGDGEVVIMDGLLNRSRRSIPFDRIQDVSVEQKPLARLFGLALVRIETGGGEQDEASLDSVSLSEATRLRAVLGRRVSSGEAAAVAVEGRQPIFAMSVGRVVTMGAFGFSLVWVGAIFAVLNSVGEVIDIGVDDLREWVGVARAEARALVTPITVLAALVIALAIGVVAGIVQTVLVEYGFSVERDGDRLRRTRGLLTRTEVVVALRRVQLALIERGAIAGRFGWSGLRFQTLGGSDDAGGRQSIAPFARDAEVDRLMDLAGLPRFDPLPLRPVAFGHVVRAAAIRGGVPVVAILAAAVMAPVALAALLLVPIPVLTAILARRHHRYAIVGATLQVMRGVLSRRAWVVPLDHIQAVSVTRTPIQRILGIATVRVGTAGARGSARPDVVDVAFADAQELAGALLRR